MALTAAQVKTQARTRPARRNRRVYGTCARQNRPGRVALFRALGTLDWDRLREHLSAVHSPWRNRPYGRTM